MIFPKRPTDQQQVTVNGLVYTYYIVDRTWYAEGSNPGSVDPQIYTRGRDWNLNVDIVTTYEGNQFYTQYKLIEKQVNLRVRQIDSLIQSIDESESENTMYRGQYDYLQDLKIKTLDVLNSEDIFSIDWPPAPPLTI